MNNITQINPQTLDMYAQNVVRHLRNNDNKRAFENFTTLIKDGASTPGYTRLTLNKAKYDNAKFLSQSVADGELEIGEALSRNKSTIMRLAKLWQAIKNTEIDKNFKKSFAEFYPKSAQHRLAIETFLEESTNELQRCSNKKLYKKLLFQFLKFI